MIAQNDYELKDAAKQKSIMRYARDTAWIVQINSDGFIFKVSKGSHYRCGVCGLAVTVD